VGAIIGYKYPGTLFRLAVQFAFPGYMQILPQMIAGVFWRRATREGAIAGTVVGTIVVVLTTFVWPNALGVTNLIWGIAFNCATLIIVSHLTSAPPERIIKTFYDEVEEQLQQEKQSA
jgi:SSS family solute:Na+ symporter